MSLFSGCLDASKRLQKVVSMHSCRPTLEKAVARGAALEFLYLLAQARTSCFYLVASMR